tara:strand:- start:438 stop:896 length:459 start_codon:yes stop_codon:yes gene_type:complete
MSDIYRYIETTDDGSLIFTESGIMLPKIKGRLLLSDSDFKKYTLHIKYIDCCSLNENTELEVDSVKVLSQRVQRIMYDIDDKSAELRKLVQEAAIFDNKEVAREIALVIKSMNKFLDSDFSNITDVNDIEQITCPELQLDYEKHFTDKIYGI